MSAPDPYAETRRHHGIRFLYRLNPLSKYAATLPVIVFLVFVRGIPVPAAVLLSALVVLFLGASLSRRGTLAVLIGFPLGIAVFGFGFGLWSDPSTVGAGAVLFQIGEWKYTSGQGATGLATALRLAAITALALIPGLTSTGMDLTRALSQQLHVPYRLSYTAVASFRFAPRFRTELGNIRAAHRVRGVSSGAGPLAALRRQLGYLIPLLAGGIRHAERLALAMDGRGFGYARTRTERHLVPWRRRDTVFVVAFWLLVFVVVCAAASLWP